MFDLENMAQVCDDIDSKCPLLLKTTNLVFMFNITTRPNFYSRNSGPGPLCSRKLKLLQANQQLVKEDNKLTVMILTMQLVTPYSIEFALKQPVLCIHCERITR